MVHTTQQKFEVRLPQHTGRQPRTGFRLGHRVIAGLEVRGARVRSHTVYQAPSGLQRPAWRIARDHVLEWGMSEAEARADIRRAIESGSLVAVPEGRPETALGELE